MWAHMTENARAALRGIRKTPGVSTAIVITLALGIGANAMMFGVIDRLLLSPPQHIADADRVRHLYIERTGSNGARDVTRIVTYPDFEDLARVPALANAAAYSAAAPEWTMGAGADARRVRVQQATASLFPTLGVHPFRGRFYNTSEDVPGAALTVVLAEEFWTRELGRDASVIGRVLQLNRGRYEVIGIAPAGFTGAELNPVDLWLPLRASAYAESGNDAGFDDRGMSWLRMVVRLKDGPGITPESVQAQLTAAHVAAVRAYELERGQAYLERRSHTPVDKQAPRLFTASVIAARGPSPSRMSSISLWLAAVSAIVLLIACANVANLLLARGIGMQRDMAIRVALGANRQRLISQSLTEAAVLATAGAIAALGVAWWSSRVVHAVILPGVAFTDTGMPRRLMLFIALAAAITALFAGLLPALQASRAADTRAEALRASRGNSSSRSAVRGVLMVGQITLSVILLIGAGLFVRGLWSAMRTDVGFDHERTLTVFIERGSDVADVNASRAERRRRQTEMYREALKRVEALPGVHSAALSAASVPFVGTDGFGTLELRIPGVDTIPQLAGGGARKYWGSEDFFATLGLSVTRGRSFTPEEFRDGAEPVAMVNETFARTVWPGQDTLSKCVVFNDPDRKRDDGTIEPGPCRRIVGIFKDVTRVSLDEEKSLQIAFPAMRDAYIKGLIVRADANVDAASLTPSIRQAVSSVSSDVRFVAVRTYADRFETLLGPWRIGSTMFTAFGVLALTVAAVGLYSLLAFAVAQRRRELGIRAALGAKRRDLIALVMHQAARFLGSGLLLGVAAALAASRYMDGMLFGVKAGDVTVYAAVALTLIGCGIAAAFVPAWRATSVQPTTAMEAE
jgi:putative ABC transport system permease protein